MTTHTTFGFGLPKSYWNTPHPTKSAAKMSTLGARRRRSSHLDTPLRAVKRRRLSKANKDRWEERNDNGFVYYTLVDAATTSKGSPVPSASNDRIDNPFRELSRSEWKARSNPRSSEPAVAADIVQPQNVQENMSLPSTKDVWPSFTFESIPNQNSNANLSDASDVSLGQDKPDQAMSHQAPFGDTSEFKSEENRPPQIPREIENPPPHDVNVVKKKKRLRDYSPSEIVRKGDKVFVKRSRKKKETYIVHENKRRKVKRRRKVMKKKKKPRKHIITYPPLEIPMFPVPKFSKQLRFSCRNDEPHEVVVTKFWMALCDSWKVPLIATYGEDVESNPFGFISRSMFRCIENLERYVPEISSSCDIVLDRREVPRETQTGRGSVLSETWFVDTLKSRSANLHAYCQALEEEIQGFDNMFAEIKQPGFIDKLFPQLALQLDFKSSEHNDTDEKEDPVLSEWNLENDLARLQIELLEEEVMLEMRIEAKDVNVEKQEEQVQILKRQLAAPVASVTKLNRVYQQLQSHTGGDSNETTRPSTKSRQPESFLITSLVQALEREQQAANMDVD